MNFRDSLVLHFACGCHGDDSIGPAVGAPQNEKWACGFRDDGHHGEEVIYHCKLYPHFDSDSRHGDGCHSDTSSEGRRLEASCEGVRLVRLCV